MKSIYISGKITGLDEQATRERFKKAQKLWMGKGYNVINPFNLYDGLKDAGTRWDFSKWGDVMIVDLMTLNRCDAIYMLDGWADSPGARIEREFAIRIGLQVIYEDLETNIQ